MAIVEVIKYNGGPDVFAWKYPSQELGTWTQLIVSEAQEAILFKSGKALDVFGSGRHTLDTANIPILSRLINLPFGGRSPFTAEVWYVNKIHSLDIKWGTSSPIQIQDPKYSVFIPVRSFGQFGIQIADAKKFLVKLVGNLSTFDKDTLIQYFRGLYLTKAKDAISSYLIHNKVSVLEINAYIDELSKDIMEKIQPVLSEYGIELLNFYINDISIPENDPAAEKLKNALAKKAEMEIIGYNYQQERSFDTLEGAAKNPGSSSGLMGAGMGLGMGAALGGTMGAHMGSIMGEINTSATVPCPKCGSSIPKDKRFCPDCGYDTASAAQPEEKQEENNSEVTCSKCGMTYGTNVKFCPGCGDKYNPCPKCGADLKDNTCPKCNYVAADPCPKCGHIPEIASARFCPECGEPLCSTCPNCGTEIQGSEKFCSECGNKL